MRSKGFPAGLLGLLMVLGIAAATPAAAQISNLSAEVRQKITAMGAALNPDIVAQTYKLFTPLTKHPDPGVRIVRDLSYGPDPLNKLDLYYLAKHQSMPIVIFARGGGYVAGDKNSTVSIYSNVTAYFASAGILAANINYRLAPDHPWPSGAQDIGAVVVWMKANAAKYGGDPNRIFLVGHSAGATHVASYVLDASLHPKEGPGVVGAVLISGEYQVSTANPPPNVVAYFGKDVAQYGARSPLSHVAESKLPLMLVMAEFDPLFLALPTLDLAHAVCVRDGKCPPLIWLKGHNHISEVASINTKDEELGRVMVDFVRSTH